jgi:cytochrome P450
MADHNTKTLPSHVSPDLVRPYPYFLGATTKEDPFSFIAEIHRGPDIFWAERVVNGNQGGWVPRRFEDVRNIWADTEHFTSRGFPPWATLLGEDWFLVPTEIDPPNHSAYRIVLNPLFTPKRLAQLDDKIRRYARDYVRGFRDAGKCEFMKDFAYAFPIQVFLELMGLPEDMVEEFLEWEHGLLHEADIEKINQATHNVNAYLRAQCDDRRKNPREDLLTFAVNAEVNGRKFTDDEVTGVCFNLFVGGLDTVSTNMGLQFRHLAERPDHQALLRAHPEMIPDAIEELMRAYATIQNTRRCIKEIMIGAVTIKVGDKVMLPSFLAGRDPEAYDRPDEVILDRKARHVTFGFGIHLCLGIHLARREMRIAMEEVLAGLPEFKIAPGAVIESYLAGTIQPIELPLVWDAGRGV